MKLLLFALALISCSTFYAQETKKKAAPFVRVYDLNGIKISKGRIDSLTDTSLVVESSEKITTIEVNRIGYIKTKRSAGNNILWGAGIGASTGLIAGAIEGESEGIFGSTVPVEENIIMGTIVLMPVGAAIGAITAITKNSDNYYINGDTTKWKAFRVTMEEQSQLP